VAIAFLATNAPREYLINKNVNPKCGEYIADYKKGREDAEKALREYENGNKEPLANILINGIKNSIARYKSKTYLDDSYVANGEMILRATYIMERDPEIMRMVMDKKTGLSKEELGSMRAVVRAGSLLSKGKNARELLNKDIKGSVTLSNAEKIHHTTTLLMSELVNYNNAQRKADKTKAPVNLMEYFAKKDDYQKLREAVKGYVLRNRLTNMGAADLEQLRNNFDLMKDAYKYTVSKLPEKKMENTAKKEGIQREIPKTMKK
jgi:hypothetical protein